MAIVLLLHFSVNKQEKGRVGKGWLVSQSNCSERRKHLPSSQSWPHFPFSQRPSFPSCFVDIATVNSERVVIILICISWWAGPVFVPNRDPGLKRGAFGIWPLEIRNPRSSSPSGMRSKEQVPPSAHSDNGWKSGIPQPPGSSAFPRG